MRILRSLAYALLALMIGLVPVQPHAQPWPQRTVRIILPLPTGGGTDLAARLFAEGLSKRWGQAVIVENRPGADGIVAVTNFIGSHDGHTLLFSFAGPISINPLVYEKLPYDPERDLVPIASAIDNFFAVAVSTSLGVESMRAFVDLARSRPGKLNWAATPGLPHYIFAALEKSAGLEMTQVPYRDFAPALQDFAEGRVQVVVTSPSYLLPLVGTGKARFLMVTNRERSPVAIDVPTAAEAGFPELLFEGVVGFYGWRNMPPALRERIAGDVAAVAADPAIGARLRDVGVVVRSSTSAEFAAAIDDQKTKVRALAGAVKPQR
jgi:tripartite-type tricarboxylate transporter receptor subunit TctC